MKYSTHIYNSNNSFFLFLIATTLSITVFGCVRESCVAHYDFQVDVTISPSDFEVNRGDTLTFSMITDNMNLIDSVGNRIVNFPNFDPRLFFLLPRIDSTILLEGFFYNEALIDSNTYTTDYIPVSTLSTGLFFFDIDTTELTSKVEFEIVLNHPGTYALHINPAIFVNERIIDFPDRCKANGGNIRATMWVNGERQKYFENLSEQEVQREEEYWSERSGSRHISSSYYFKVVE